MANRNRPRLSRGALGGVLLGFALLSVFSYQTATAQTVTFDNDDYKAVGVYDTWEQSPFRTGVLKGNAAVVSNHLQDVDERMGVAPDVSPMILGVQRSRFGSNTFGARIDLKQTFELTTQTRYVHVLINKPVEGRVMLVGLGKRRERAGQSPEAEQFWVLSLTKVEADKWCDAVFPIKGAAGIDIYSLVVVPDCESPHKLENDFAAYIDDIVINDDPTTRTQREDYPLNFDPDATYTRTDRGLKAVRLEDETLIVAEAITKDLKAYQDLTRHQFRVSPGQRVTPTFTYQGSWMSGYVYVDWGNDGKFTAEVNPDGTPAAGADIAAYSYYEGHNSAGQTVANGNVLNPPAFTVPAGQPYGFYRMRYKVDWNSIDAGGNVSAGNHILSNGGAVVDLRLNVHPDIVNVNDANRNGEVLAADGSQLSNYKAAFGQPLTIRMNPERGFLYDGIIVRHGYNLTADSLLHGTPQYSDTLFTRQLFNADDEFTIPADVIDGDILIQGLFVQDHTPVEVPVPEDYTLVFQDEFDAPDGSAPDPSRWSSSNRSGSVWNRYVKDHPDVAYIDGGALVCRALKNTDPDDEAPLMTGAQETRGKFSFTYGIVQVRLKTTPHVGNFPAAWMMPQPPADTWPNAGEIDIFEAIDDQLRAWHTVHTNWTYNLGHNADASFSEWLDVNRWHVYGLEWTEDAIAWTIDGQPVARYEKSADSNALDEGQWPFTHDFYLILNQSVGNGAWAQQPDEDFIYETRFDYVRVYQKDDPTGITPPEIRPRNANAPAYDIQGRRITRIPSRGIFIQNGRKYIK